MTQPLAYTPRNIGKPAELTPAAQAVGNFLASGLIAILVVGVLVICGGIIAAAWLYLHWILALVVTAIVAVPVLTIYLLPSVARANKKPARR